MSITGCCQDEGSTHKSEGSENPEPKKRGGDSPIEPLQIPREPPEVGGMNVAMNILIRKLAPWGGGVKQKVQQCGTFYKYLW